MKKTLHDVRNTLAEINPGKCPEVDKILEKLFPVKSGDLTTMSELSASLDRWHIINFTHNDGDGIASAIVTDYLYSHNKFRVIPIFCTVQNINDRLFEYIYILSTIYWIKYPHYAQPVYDEFIDTVSEDEKKISIVTSIKDEINDIRCSNETSSLRDYLVVLFHHFPEFIIYNDEFTSFDYLTLSECGMRLPSTPTVKTIHSDGLPKPESEVTLPSSVVITDVIIDETNTKLLDILVNMKIMQKLIYVDHHASNDFDNERYKWGHVAEYDVNGQKMAACSQYLTLMTHESDNKYFHPLITTTIEDASMYDVWAWDRKDKNPQSSSYRATILTALITNCGYYHHNNSIKKLIALNNLFYDLRRNIFLNLRKYPTLLSCPKYAQINKAYREKMSYAEETGKFSCVIVNGKDLGIEKMPKSALYGLVPLGKEFVNITMSGACEKNIGSGKPDIVIGFTLTSNKISLRRGTTKYDLGVLASLFNGGGHPDAAGCFLEDQDLIKLISVYIINRPKPKKGGK